MQIAIMINKTSATPGGVLPYIGYKYYDYRIWVCVAVQDMVSGILVSNRVYIKLLLSLVHLVWDRVPTYRTYRFCMLSLGHW